ncbi:alpha/beta hydrolase [Sulfoacidibacillus thermotolerans]|uniref:Serine aminopeptidase S33 domain-containing protein n=1 Tax=Sulfoacidibacillus thermotolerans TaxID=1765684 RepID=A0A2U3D913_SULT2|nr:alpha/beta hydrolase [Sulfoacidibacillus thermotolerans]PWI57766.1 hypothetical protein BM613_07235 [Sulfoacidibacillus thermotolerans]
MVKPWYHLSFRDVEQPLYVITLIHGAGEYSGRYDEIREQFAAHQIATVMGDLPGHGHSPGQRGHIDSFDEYVQAALSFLATARERYGGRVPHVLLGHSMGGVIATLATARTTLPADALVLSSPAFALRMEIPWLRRMLARALLPIAPRLAQQNGILSSDVTRNQIVAQAYETDHLISHTVTLRWYFEFLAAMQKSFEECSNINIPISIWQGGADRLVNVEKVRQFVQTCENKQISYREFPGLYHEILNEPEREEVISEILAWLTTTLRK